MTRRQRYFMKQKLIGLAMIILGIIPSFLMEDGNIFIVCVPMGLCLLFTKEMLWIDDYYREMEDRKMERRRS